MVNGYHLHKAADRKCLPDGNHRLVLKEGLELARIQHDGCAAVCKSSEGNNRRIWVSYNLQHRPGKPVYIYVFIKVLVDYDIQISMDGKERALDNIRIERLWRSLKYEDIYLKRYETMKELKEGINAYFNFYNTARFHQSLDYNVPDEMYKCFQYNELERKRADKFLHLKPVKILC